MCAEGRQQQRTYTSIYAGKARGSCNVVRAEVLFIKDLLIPHLFSPNFIHFPPLLLSLPHAAADSKKGKEKAGKPNPLPRHPKTAERA